MSAGITQQTDLTLATLSSFLKTISKFDTKLGQQAPSAFVALAKRVAALTLDGC